MSDNITENIEISGIRKVKIGSIGMLHLMQGEEESLRIEASEDIMDRVKVKISNDELKLGLKNSVKKRRFNNDVDLDYFLTVKDITELNISGAVSVIVGDLEVESFHLETSGATKSEFSAIATRDLRLSASGASKIVFDSLQADVFTLDLSGATKIQSGSVKAESIKAGMSGACSIKFSEGKVNSQDLKLSGACKYDVSDVESKEVSFHSSGAGKASVWATEELDISISGVGKLGYKGHPRIQQQSSGPVKITNID